MLFADVVGFTPYCDAHAAGSRWSPICSGWSAGSSCEADAVGVQKIKTIGDAFMAAANLLRPVARPGAGVCPLRGGVLAAAAEELPPHWQVRDRHPRRPGDGRRRRPAAVPVRPVGRHGQHRGPGADRPAEPGTVTLSRAAWERVADCCRGTSRGVVHVKGKGEMELVRWDG